jgi:hypothetical protein
VIINKNNELLKTISMNKKIFLFSLALAVLLSAVGVQAQVHIGSLTEPKATLEVTDNATDATAPGIIAPRLTLANLQAADAKYTADQKGAIVYVDNATGTPAGKTVNVTAIGYYYFDGAVWQRLQNSPEPWNVSGTTTPATSNTQNIYQAGRVGIVNSNTPVAKRVFNGPLTIINNNGANADDDVYLYSYSTSGANQAAVMLNHSRGTIDAPENSQSGDILGSLVFRGQINGGQTFLSQIRANYLGDGTTNRSNLQFFTSGAPQMTIDSVGNVGIGSSPVAKLDIYAGANPGKGFKMRDGTQGAGRVLTSDANGVGTWTTPQSANDSINKYAWKLSGNAVASGDFLGTTNAQPLILKVNNDTAGIIRHNSPYTTAIGYQAAEKSTGSDNTAFGYNALLTNTSGQGNTAAGANALKLNTTGSWNTALGEYAMQNNTTGNNNTALGQRALESNTTGGGNIAVGLSTLAKSTTGGGNVAIGEYAIENNTTGSDNVGIGHYVMRQNTVGQGNTAVGEQAMRYNTEGNGNTALGRLVLVNNTTGNNNTAAGFSALSANTSGDRNIGIGPWALHGNISGPDNIGIGTYALNTITNSANNIAFGYGAGSQLVSGDHNTFINYNNNYYFNGVFAGLKKGYDNILIHAAPKDTVASHQLKIGGYFTGQSIAHIGEDNYDSSAASDYRLGVFGNPHATTMFYVNGSAGGTGAWINASDRRLKESIKPLDYGLQQVLELQPVRYTFKKEPGVERVGFVAQDVRSVVPEVVTGTEGDIEKGETLGVGYAELVPVLVKAIQEQQKTIEELKARIEALEAE